MYLSGGSDSVQDQQLKFTAAEGTRHFIFCFWPQVTFLPPAAAKLQLLWPPSRTTFPTMPFTHWCMLLHCCWLLGLESEQGKWGGLESQVPPAPFWHPPSLSNWGLAPVQLPIYMLLQCSKCSRLKCCNNILKCLCKMKENFKTV